MDYANNNNNSKEKPGDGDKLTGLDRPKEGGAQVDTRHSVGNFDTVNREPIVPKSICVANIFNKVDLMNLLPPTNPMEEPAKLDVADDNVKPVDVETKLSIN